jgi:PAS domain S-box-containing protein
MYRKVCILIIILFTSLTNLFSKEANPTLLRSASEYDYPPFCIVNEDGTAGGFSVELLRAACEAMDMKIDFKVGEWSVIKQELADGKLDVLPLVGRTPENEPLFDFTFSYMTYHGAVFARTGEKRFKTREDLKKARLIVMKGDNAEDYVRRVKLADSVYTTFSFEDAFKNLSEGKCDIVVTQKVMGLNLVKQSGIVNVEPLNIEINDFQQNFCFAVPKGRHELISLINEGLSVVIANRTYNRIHQKWFEPLSEIGKTTLVIAGDANYPPFSFIDENGKYVGSDVETSYSIAKDLGLMIDLRAEKWSVLMENFKNGEYDAVQGILFSEEREKYMDFSIPYLVSTYRIFAVKGRNIPENISELKNYKVAVEDGNIMHEISIEEGLQNDLVVLDSHEEALLKLVAGEADYALLSYLTAIHYIKKHGIKNVEFGEKGHYKAEFCYSVRKGNIVLLANINNAIAGLQASGRLREINSKWFGAHHEDGINYRRMMKYAAALLIPIILFLIGFILWNDSLKKQVRKKTTELISEVERRKESEDMLRQNEMLLKDNEEKYRQIFESASVGIFMTIPDGTILSANPEACTILGRSEEEIIRLGRDSIFDKRDPKFQESLSVRKSTGIYRGEISAVLKNGSKLPLFLTSKIYKNPKGEERSITIFSDISQRKISEAKLEDNLKDLEKSKKATLNLLKDIQVENDQRKRAQEELKKLNAELEEKVKERTAQLEKQNRELQMSQDSLMMLMADVNESRKELEKVNGLLVSANKELEAFSYSVSHDLRSPLRAITGFADIVKNEYCKDIDPEGIRFINRIVDNSEKMKTLIEDLLEFSRVGRAQIRTVTVDLKTEAEKIFTDLAAAEGDRKFEFCVSEEIPKIQADRTLFLQMLENIISNAVKFTAKKDIAVIKINYEKADNFHIITFEDNGAGFEDKYKHKIFEVFQRLHTSEEFPGTGVGMSIVAKVASKHGWKIDAEGVVGKGAEFILKIPINEGRKND